MTLTQQFQRVLSVVYPIFGEEHQSHIVVPFVLSYPVRHTNSNGTFSKNFKFTAVLGDKFLETKEYPKVLGILCSIVQLWLLELKEVVESSPSNSSFGSLPRTSMNLLVRVQLDSLFCIFLSLSRPPPKAQRGS
ncbi:hypothetical protein KY284_036253 [Solanum tuberosum]|nr:hypothetical protein KY284_036253 [Solanum tuberosum]